MANQNLPRDEHHMLRRIDALEKRIKALETAPRAGSSSFGSGRLVIGDPAATPRIELDISTGEPLIRLVGTSIIVYGMDGETLRQRIGLHSDGTVGSSAMNGPVPPKPSTPVLTPGQLSLTVAWDGGFLDAAGAPADRPTDLRHVEVHVSSTAGFTPDASTLQGTLAEAGSLVVQPLEVVAQHVRLISVTTSLVSSAPSSEASAMPLQVVASDIVDGIVTAVKLADNAVTEAKIASSAVTGTKIADDSISTPKLVAGSVQTSKIAAGAVDAGTIAAGAVTTAKLDALAVTADKVAANAVTAGKIAAGAVTAGTLETDLAVIGTVLSPNYVTGTSGWSVKGDGTAEFNDLTARGEVLIGPDNGPQVHIYQSGGDGFIEFPTNSPSELGPAHILAGTANDGLPNEFNSLQIRGPNTNSGFADRIEMQFNSQNDDGTSQANWSVGVFGEDQFLLAQNSNFLVTSDNFRVNKFNGDPVTFIKLNASTPVQITQGPLTFGGTTITQQQRGKATLVFDGVVGFIQQTVTFPVAFTSIPFVWLTIQTPNAAGGSAVVRLRGAPTTASFSVEVRDRGNAAYPAGNVVVHWRAET